MAGETINNIGVGVSKDASGYYWYVQMFGDYESA